VPPLRNLLNTASGRLYLTSEKLYWKRLWFNVPGMGPDALSIQLADIRRCFLTGWMLGVATTTGEYRFSLVKARIWPPAFWFSPTTAEEWCDAINASLVRDAGA
jgi:hypothetical protein